MGPTEDGLIKLEVTADAMAVLASVAAGISGQALTVAVIEQALLAARLEPACFDHQAIAELIDTPHADGVVIARGRPSEDGADSHFEPLVQGVIHHAPTRHGDGNVDQFDINEFVVVEAGTELMRLHPATPGVDGYDVYGNAISARPGKQKPFARDLAGTCIDPEDEHLLLAQAKGHPVILADGVRVEESITLPAVDLRSGDIRFDGSIYVKGDISAGVEIYASGDVTVKGMVEHAVIEAGGNITVGIGIVNPEPHGIGPVPEGVHLKAAGNIQAKYVSGAWLEAGGDIIVKEYIAHSVTETAGHVLVGQAGGQGRIFGGRCHGRKGVAANRLGSNASADTLISAGVRTPPHEARETLLEELDRLRLEKEEIMRLISRLTCEAPGEASLAADETCIKLHNTLTILDQKAAKAQLRLRDIEADLAAAAGASITAAKSLRARVTLCIHGVRRSFASRDAGGTFHMVDKKVVRTE